MKGSQEGEGKRHLSTEPVASGKGRFLKTGFFSLFLHIALIVLVVLNLRLAATKCEPTVCQVMIKPLVPPDKGIKPARLRPALARKSSLPPLLSAEPRVQKEEKKWIQEVDLPEPAPVKKSMDQEMPAPVEPVVAEISFKKPQLLPPQEEPKTAKLQEEPKTVREVPVIAAMAPLDVDSEIKKKEKEPSKPISHFSPRLLIEHGPPDAESEERTEIKRGEATRSASVAWTGVGGGGVDGGAPGKGSGTGEGSPGGFGKGSGTGQGDPGGSGKGSGTGQGGLGGSEKGSGTGQGGLGGFGNGSGAGQGGLGGFVKGSGIGQGDLGGNGKGSGTGQGDYGLGPGNGSGGGGGTGNEGPGKGGTGNGGSGNGGMGVPRPRYAENPDPVYPSEARKKGYQGVVMLRVEVLASGLVGRVELKKSSGYEVLDQSALAAVKKWKFVPAKKEDVAVSVWVSIPIKFHLL